MVLAAAWVLERGTALAGNCVGTGAGRRSNQSARKSALKAEVKQILAEDQDLLKAMVAATLQQTLEAEMDEALAAEKSERTVARLG